MIEIQINMMDDLPEQPPLPEPQQPRKKRSGTRRMEITEPQEVQFNNFGQHCGDKQNKFATDCGVLTRELISIGYLNWKKVPNSAKDNLWLAIKVCYVTPMSCAFI